MTLAEHALFAHVAQGQLFAIVEHLLQLGRADVLCHGMIFLLSATAFKPIIVIDACPIGVLRDL